MLQIRPIREDDAPAFHALVDGVCRERRFLATCESPPLENTRSFVSSNVKNGCPQYVAEENSTLIGWCDAIPGGPTTFSRHVARLGMGVHADHRGRGIGSLLLHAVIARTRELGLEKIELGVYASNEPAIRLYRSVGFTEEGTLRRARLLDGKYDDILMMALWLNGDGSPASIGD